MRGAMHGTQSDYAQNALSALQHLTHVLAGGKHKETEMSCIPTHPIVAEDPLSYFMPNPNRVTKTAPPLPQPTALEQMYGYYTVE